MFEDILGETKPSKKKIEKEYIKPFLDNEDEDEEESTKCTNYGMCDTCEKFCDKAW